VKRQSEKIGAVMINGHFQSLGLIRSLGKKGVPIYLLDTGPCIARFSKYVKKYFRCPPVLEENRFLEFLLSLARENGLNGWIIYPNDDEAVCFLARHKEQLGEYYRIMTPDWEVVKYAYDKIQTYQLAEKCGVPIPKTYYPATIEELEKLQIEYPAILKPSIKVPFYWETKKKAIRVENREQLLAEFTRAIKLITPSQTMMVQELIPGRTKGLFSVGSLCNSGKVLAGVVVQRPRQHPMDFGHATTFAQTVDMPRLEKKAEKILGEMGYSGLSEVEFMQDPRDGEYKLIEINARAWGWHTIAIKAGVDLPYLSYLDILGESVSADGFAKGVKWINLVTDTPTVLIELVMGRMKLSEYLRSIKGKKEYAVMSLNDPLPFIMQLIMLPYLLCKKGFW
jgi:D-aspartate ligase